MSRIGKKPVAVPGSVKVNVVDRLITVENGGEKLTFEHRPEVSVRVEADQVVVERQDDSRVAKAMHGLTRSLISNMITGVTEGYVKELDVVGVGWTAQLKGIEVHLNLGYADTRIVKVPAGVKVEINGQRIKVTGANKQQVGQCAAEMRAHRKPEPYNGKGVKYVDEVIVRKQGKAFGSA